MATQTENRVSYEWVVEWTKFYNEPLVGDVECDIVELDHDSKLTQVIKYAEQGYNPDTPNIRPRIALIRYYESPRHDIMDRGYAYITEDGLEEIFCTDQKVPAARIKAVANQMERLKAIPHFAFVKKGEAF